MEDGGVILLEDSTGYYLTARINGTIYGKEGSTIEYTTIQRGGFLDADGGNVWGSMSWGAKYALDVQEEGLATFKNGVSMNGVFHIEHGGRLYLYDQTDAKFTSINLDLSKSNDPDKYDYALVDNLQYLEGDSKFLVINVNAEQAEGKYLLATNVGTQSQIINFTVNGTQITDSDNEIWRFWWNEEKNSYTGITYNDQNYVLKNEGGNLYLTVENVDFNIFYYYSRNDNGIACKEDIARVKNSLLDAELTDNTNIYLVMDNEENGQSDCVYRIIGSSAYLMTQINEINPNNQDFSQYIQKWDKETIQEKATNAVIFSTHGGGFIAGNNGADASISGIASSLSGKNISIFDFDACLMSSIESLYSLNGTVPYLMASETDSRFGSHGSFNQDTLVNLITENQDMKPEYYFDAHGLNFADSYFHAYVKTLSETNISTTILSYMNSFAERFFALSADDKNQLSSIILKVRSKLSSAKAKDMGWQMIDIKEFCNELCSSLKKSNNFTEIKSIIGELANNITPMLLNLNKVSNWGGISVFLPVWNKKNVGDSEVFEDYLSGKSSYFYSLRDTKWGKFVNALFDYSKGVLFSASSGLTTTELASTKGAKGPTNAPSETGDIYQDLEGETAWVLGKFTGNAFSLEEETLYYENDTALYTLSIGDQDMSGASLSLKALDGVNVRLALLDSSLQVVSESDLAEEVSLSLDGLSEGEYVLFVTGEGNTRFSLSGAASWSNGNDRFDEEGNNDLEHALQMSENQYKMLLANPSTPDFFSFSNNISDSTSIIVWGSNLDADSLAVQLLDTEGNAVADVEWDEENHCYRASTSNEGYVKVQSNTGGTVGYNLRIEDEMPECQANGATDIFTAKASATLNGKTPQNFLVSRLTAGSYTLTGDFANNMNATITITDLATGKKAGTLSIKKGVIAKQTSFLLDGDYMFTIAGDGKSTGDANITLTGTVHAGADNSDDTFTLAQRAEPISYVEGSVGFGDSVDWMLADIAAPGRYDISLTGLDAAAKVSVTLWSSVNGAAPKKIASKNTTGKDLSITNLLLPATEGTKYYVSVSCDNASKGVITPYQFAITGTSYDVIGADNSDDTLDTSSSPFTFANSGVLDAASGKYLNTASLDGWVGYGDTVDVIPLEITNAAQWAVSLVADVPSSVTLTLQSKNKDSESGEYKYTKLASAKADAKGQVNFSQLLQEGSYVLTVASNDAKGDKFNTAYTLQLNETAKFAELDLSSGDSFSLAKGETRTFNLTSMAYVAFTKNSNLTLWKNDGKNGKSSIKLAYDKTGKAYGAMLTPGTYFLTASNAIYDVGVTTTYPDRYGRSMLTDNNGFGTANYIFGYRSSFVGYGDGIDCYCFTIDEYDLPGDYTFSISDTISNTVQVTIFSKSETRGKVSYKKLGNFVHKTGESTSLTLKDLLDGEYYIKVESLSYSDYAKEKASLYDLRVREENLYTLLELDADLASADSAIAKNSFAVYCGTGYGNKSTVYKLDARIANGYEVYVNNGDGKLTKVKTYDNTFILDDDRLFYVKATKDNKDYNQGLSLSILNENERGTWGTPYFTEPDENRWILYSTKEDTIHREGWSGWVGYGMASDTFEFNTFEGGDTQAGWAHFEVADIDKSLGDTGAMSLTLTLEECNNGVWKKVGSTTAKSTYNKKNDEWLVSGKALEAVLTDNSSYRLIVATSDKGAGQCSGNYLVTGSVDAFDGTNNTFASPTLLDAARYDGTIAKKGDAIDVLDLAEIDNFYLNMDSGSAKLTFYDENYNAVALTGNFLTNTAGNQVGALKKAASVTLKANDAKSDGLYLADSDILDLGIRFARIEAAGTANNHYHICNSIA